MFFYLLLLIPKERCIIIHVYLLFSIFCQFICRVGLVKTRALSTYTTTANGALYVMTVLVRPRLQSFVGCWVILGKSVNKWIECTQDYNDTFVFCLSRIHVSSQLIRSISNNVCLILTHEAYTSCSALIMYWKMLLNLYFTIAVLQVC